MIWGLHMGGVDTTHASISHVMQGWHKPKKVGRPITYNGDPNAPELTEAERRRVKRRIANRESARRVQQRRKEMIDELQHKVLAVYPCLGFCFLFLAVFTYNDVEWRLHSIASSYWISLFYIIH